MPRITDSISFISRCGVAYRRQALEKLGITHQVATLLLQLERAEGVSQDELAQKAVLNKSNVARQLTSMEESGLVERRTCPKDKRVIRLYLTDKGRQTVPAVREAFDSWEQMLMHNIESPEALKQAVDVLRQSAKAWWEDDND